MQKADASPNGPDETDALLQSDRNGYRVRKRLGSSEEREKYLETPLNDEFIPPLFSENEEELEKSGLKDAFTTLHNEGEFPGKNMLEFKEKGNQSIALGKKNEAGNIQYYRDTIAML